MKTQLKSALIISCSIFFSFAAVSQTVKQASNQSTLESTEIRIQSDGEIETAVFKVNGKQFTWEQLNHEQKEKVKLVQKRLMQAERKLLEEEKKLIEMEKTLEKGEEKLEKASELLRISEKDHKASEEKALAMEKRAKEFAEIARTKEKMVRELEEKVMQLETQSFKELEAELEKTLTEVAESLE